MWNVPHLHKKDWSKCLMKRLKLLRSLQRRPVLIQFVHYSEDLSNVPLLSNSLSLHLSVLHLLSQSFVNLLHSIVLVFAPQKLLNLEMLFLINRSSLHWNCYKLLHNYQCLWVFWIHSRFNHFFKSSIIFWYRIICGSMAALFWRILVSISLCVNAIVYYYKAGCSTGMYLVSSMYQLSAYLQTFCLLRYLRLYWFWEEYIVAGVLAAHS